jgi:hypothetical protein
MHSHLRLAYIPDCPSLGHFFNTTLFKYIMLTIKTPSNPRFASSLKRYDYCPLDTSRQQIRLAKFRQDKDGTIQCEIRTVDYDDCPDYDALSYMWGPVTPLFAIVVNGDSRLEIRENLHQCLLQYCAENRQLNPRYVWVDQICIDQSSTLEKNHQVGLMSTIYSRSETVISWLAGGSALRELQVAAAGIDEDTWSTETEGLEHVQTILNNPYFTRIWIVQEVLLAKHVCVMTQGYNTSRDFWYRMNEFMRFNRYKVPPSSGQDLLALHPCGLRRLSLVNCLGNFCNHTCENSLDRVYGLMGIVEEEERLTIDYDKTSLDVFLDFFNTIISHSRSNEYSLQAVASETIQRTLRSLARSMDVSYAQQQGLNQLLLEVTRTDPEKCNWSQALDKCHNGYNCHIYKCICGWRLVHYLNPSEIVAAGLEKATVTANNSGPETQLAYDRWWYDFRYRGDGTTSRRYIDCSMTEPASEAYDVAVESQNTGAE